MVGGRPREADRFVRAGETIVRRGEAAAEVFVIRSGQVEIRRDDAAGADVVARLGPGDFFGEMSVLGHAHHGRVMLRRWTPRVVRATEAA